MLPAHSLVAASCMFRAGNVERPGIVIGPTSEAGGGPCLGPASGAEDLGNRLRPASPREPAGSLVGWGVYMRCFFLVIRCTSCV